MVLRRCAAVLVIAALTMASGCGGGDGPKPSPRADAAPKVLVVVEENRTYDEVLGSGQAPYLSALAGRFGVLTDLQAGYDPQCPSLAGYLILTSGTDHGVCDNDPPSTHELTGDSIFAQVKAGGREWRVYAESMPGTCWLTDAENYAVRHTAAPYYSQIRADCEQWHVPLGSPSSGALHDHLAAGQLPAFSLVIPDLCNDMHGGEGCRGDIVRAGDDWLRDLLSRVMAGPDWASGRLTVVITWDEGSDTDNHIPGLVLSPRTSKVQAAAPATQCSVLRLIADLLRVAPLGCAGGADPLGSVFGLT